MARIYDMYVSDGQGGEEQVHPRTNFDAVINHKTGEKLTDVVSEIKDSIKEFAPITYGVEFMRGALDTVAVRWIGDEQYKESNPIFYDFKASKVKNGEVTDVLNQVNWFETEKGTPSNLVWTEPEHDDGSDITIANQKGFYYLGGGTNPIYERHIVSYTPFSYDGDIAQYIEPFGVSADFAVIKNNMQRCIVDMTTMGSRAAGTDGSQYMMDRGGWPSTNISRFNAELYARNKNADNTQNVPYANSFQLDLRVWHSLLLIQFGTKDLHAQNLCGGGISSNDATPTDLTWGTKSGVRFKRNGQYVYYMPNSTQFYSAEGGTGWNFSQILTNYRSGLRIMEMQQALSHASANGIGEDTLFAYEGFDYSYANIAGTKGMADGVMTARVRKLFSTEITAWDNTAKENVENLELEWCLEQPIINGKIGDWGNIWMWYSGVERLASNIGTVKSELYQTDDVRMLTTDTEVGDKDEGYIYDFTRRYTLVGEFPGSSYGYNLELLPNSLWLKKRGGTLHTGECCYLSLEGAPPVGKVSRRGVYFRGRAYYTYCSSRAANAHYAPTFANMTFGVGFRVTLTKPQSGA